MSSDGLINFFDPINIVRKMDIRRNRRVLDDYIGQALEKRFATRHSRGQQKIVIDLALTYYLKEEKKLKNTHQTKYLDPAFKKVATSQVKAFLFAGHDTTSSTICYAYYHLSKAPDCLRRIRDELDEILGQDRTAAAGLISQKPAILNQLVYTTAVLKETLRLFPPASSLHQGQKGYFINNPRTGESFPTQGCLIWPISVGIHRDSATWGPDANLFRPGRFMTEGSANKRDAFVAFSRGLRNCMGQDLAMTESKIILALTVREYDFMAAFDELDELKNDGTGYPSDTRGRQTQFDEEAYQIQLGAAKPREGMPCRLSLRQ